MKKYRFASILLIVIFTMLAACGSGEIPEQEITASATATPIPSHKGESEEPASRAEEPSPSISVLSQDTYPGQGNLSGNITNGGFVAEIGDSLFFATRLGIYRSGKNAASPEQAVEKISEDVAVYLNATESWLYYAVQVGNREQFAPYYQIYRISHDGSRKEALGGLVDGCEGLIYHDGWLYYSAQSKQETISDESFWLNYQIQRDGPESHEGVVYGDPYAKKLRALYRMSSDGQDLHTLATGGDEMSIYLDAERLYYSTTTSSRLGELYYLRCYWLDINTLKTTEIPIDEYPSSENDDRETGEPVVDPVLGRIGLWGSILAHDESLFISDAGGTGGDHNYLMELRMDAPEESRQLFVGQGDWVPAVIAGDWMYYYYAREYYPMDDIEAIALAEGIEPRICRTHLATGENQVVFAGLEGEYSYLNPFSVLGDYLYLLPSDYPPISLERIPLPQADGTERATVLETAFVSGEEIYDEENAMEDSSWIEYTDDLNGDGYGEKIAIEFGHQEIAGERQRIAYQIYINREMLFRQDDYRGSWPLHWIIDLDKNDDSKEILIGSYGEGIYQSELLVWDGEKVKHLGIFSGLIIQHLNEDLYLHLDGDGNVYEPRFCDLFYTFTYYQKHTFDEATLTLRKEPSEEYEIVCPTTSAVLKDLEAFQERDVNGAAFTVKAGAEITFIATDGKDWIQFQTGDKTGWLLREKNEQGEDCIFGFGPVEEYIEHVGYSDF